SRVPLCHPMLCYRMGPRCRRATRSMLLPGARYTSVLSWTSLKIAVIEPSTTLNWKRSYRQASSSNMHGATSSTPSTTIGWHRSLPTRALPPSMSYDATSGVQTSVTGPNTGQTFNEQYDALFRQTQVTTPEGGQTTSTYTPNQVSSVTKMNATQSSDQETFLDGYGRTKRVAIANGTGWYLTDYCYDAAGLLQYQSVPYFSSAVNPSGIGCCSG